MRVVFFGRCDAIMVGVVRKIDAVSREVSEPRLNSYQKVDKSRKLWLVVLPDLDNACGPRCYLAAYSVLLFYYVVLYTHLTAYVDAVSRSRQVLTISVAVACR